MLLAGCAAPTPREQVSRMLESGDALYLELDTAPLKSDLANFYSAVENATARSGIGGRDKLQCAMTIVKLAIKLSGIDETVRFGASSTSLDGKWFSNRVAFAASPGCSGWLWHGGGAAEDRLARIGELPADTVSAADFGVDFAPALRRLEDSGAGEVLKAPNNMLMGMSPRELLLSLSGDWSIAFTAPRAGKDGSKNADHGIFISLPDRDGLLFRRAAAGISMLAPEAKRDGDTVYLPEHGGMAPVVKAGKGRISFYSSPELMAGKRQGPGTLREQPFFRKAIELLPKEVHGAFYFSEREFRQQLRPGGGPASIAFPNDGEHNIGVWKNRDGLVGAYSISDAPMQTLVLHDLALTPLSFVAERMLNAPARPQKANRTEKRVRTQPKREPETHRCRKQLSSLWRELEKYRAEHGGLPEGFGAAALKKALPETPGCGGCAYVYFGSFGEKSSPKLPLAADAPSGGAHRGAVNVLLADGSVETVELENPSMKRLCSYLHTVYRYDEKEFVQLIGRASQLDSEGK